MQGYGAGAPELGILPGDGVQNKNQDPELSLKFRTGAEAMVTWEVTAAWGSFIDTNGYAKKTYVRSL